MKKKIKNKELLVEFVFFLIRLQFILIIPATIWQWKWKSKYEKEDKKMKLLVQTSINFVHLTIVFSICDM